MFVDRFSTVCSWLSRENICSNRSDVLNVLQKHNITDPAMFITNDSALNELCNSLSLMEKSLLFDALDAYGTFEGKLIECVIMGGMLSCLSTL